MSNDKIREEFEQAFHQARCQMICVAEDRPVAWAFFLASREALVVELPHPLEYTGCSTAIKDCREAIEAAGVKVSQ